MLKRIAIIALVWTLAVAGVAGAAVSLPSFVVPKDSTVREAAVYSEAAEMHLPSDQPFTSWLVDPAIFEADQGDKVELRQVVEPDVKTIKVADLVPPIRFREGEAEIPQEYLAQLRGVLESMRDRANVRLHFVGHADSQSLSPTLQQLYGDNLGLSRERAGTCAEYCQRALGLPPEAISYEGVGDARPLASNATEAGRARNRRVEVEVWYDEVGEKLVEKEVVVPREINRVKVCRAETVCKLRYQEGHSHRARIKNLIAPLHYGEGMLSVPEGFLQQVGQSLHELSGKGNVVVKFIAYADNTPLQGRPQRIYGDQLGLTKAVARRVALAVQEKFGLANAAVEIEGRGATRPAASNETPQGRALNRRVEVEFWHDDPLQDLPDEPQLCPDAAGAETVTRVYDPPGGAIAPIRFENGEPIILPATLERLRQAMNEIADRSNVRLRFIGYLSNERLDRRTAAIYGDDIGWSTVRARRALAAVSDQLGLTEEQTEFEGRGYVQTADVVNAGFTASASSRVEVQVVYDELLALDDYDGVEITRLTREVHPADPFGLNLMRITVDGRPLDDPGKSIPDVQRCTDVALDQAEVRFRYDNLKLKPRLNVTAWPRAISYRDLPETEFSENLIRFRLYNNYPSFIERGEVRIFAAEQSLRDTPLAVIALDAAGLAEWQPSFENYAAPGINLKYLVRVYDSQGHFDETSPQPLWVLDHIDQAVARADAGAELLAGYGESRIASRQIPLQGGTVEAYGSAIPAGHKVWLAGYAVPVDARGRFVAETILPEGLHTVEVAVLDAAGNGELFLRDLALKRSDWFTVGIADLTASVNQTDGPARLLAPDQPQYSDDFDLQGRLAFYTKGKFGAGWNLTASADTREGPFDEIFSNFLDKSPEALFRRIDPDDHYPTYGDDGTVEDDAPTRGKLYLKLQKHDNYGLWGNFRIGYTDNDLGHVDRGLYGANLHYQTLDATSFGEQRLMIDGFAAEPGTVAGRDEFRGTGGSLYYLQRQDLLEGSERLRIEVRDKDSGLVLGVKNLTPALDYDIDYLQGRILLTRPLSPTANDDLLVQSDGLSGHPMFLVARYEFTPGFDDPETLTTGGRAHYWFGDAVKLGVTASQDDEVGSENRLGAADLTLRKSAQTWIKLQAGRSEGPGLPESTSGDGGFNFGSSASLDGGDAAAGAWRADASLGLEEFFASGRGKFTLYGQELEAGYAAPGLITAKQTTQFGATADLPFGERVSLRLKADRRVEEQGLETAAGELNVDLRTNEHWTVSSGVRSDSRKDNSTQVPLTQVEGDRTDAVVRLLYDSRERWTAYGYLQGSIAKSGNREQNGRIGSGGSFRLSDRFKVDGEVSGGGGGAAGRLGTEYLYSDRTTLYLNYALENERSDNGLRARKGNLASGFRTRYSDSASIYLEERYAHGDVPTGLMHSTGVDLAPTDRLNFSANLDFGTLTDNRTGADLERTAAGVSAGYGFAKLKLASALEYRVDDSEQPDLGTTRRTTWLLKNSLKYQLSPDWRLIGKFNYAYSESSQGQFYDGNYTEAVLGYAYRPVRNDRLNALLKYTYFYNVPAADQLSTTDAAADVIQRSHIAALDVTYDLTPRWTLGGKYAYRHGELSQDRVNREFFTSRAQLVVLRADWHFVHRWDALVEGRLLDLPDAGECLNGALVGLYRHLGEHIKVGAGYNFSNFSDDLTDLDYDHQGLFINLIGKI
ncbi:MAG TPA: OmpA family protein [Geothermobacteraceae bacterium]|nr:OmpA family protein [Geothermobacteraceae bacterium]